MSKNGCLPDITNIEAWIAGEGSDWVAIPHSYWCLLENKWTRAPDESETPARGPLKVGAGWPTRVTPYRWAMQAWPLHQRAASLSNETSNAPRPDTPIVERNRDASHVALRWRRVYEARVNDGDKQIRVRFVSILPAAWPIKPEVPEQKPPPGAPDAAPPAPGTSPPPARDGS